MTCKLPSSPFSGQIFIDSSRIKWRWNQLLQVWERIGIAEMIPLASEIQPGLMSSQDKILLDSVPKGGGGFGIVVKPQLILSTPQNPDGVLTGDLVLRSNSLEITCVSDLSNSVGCVSTADTDESSGLTFALKQVFLDTFCLEISGSTGPTGDKGIVGNRGKDGFNNSPAGERGDAGIDAITPVTFSGIQIIESDEVSRDAIVALELDAAAGRLSYTLSAMNVPEDDEPADQFIATPVQRVLYYPILADNPNEYVTLDDWRLTSVAGDPLYDEPDFLLLKMPATMELQDEIPVQTVRLTDFIQSVVEHYKVELREMEKTYLKQIKDHIEAKDAAARSILASLAQQLAECEFARPLQFCIGLHPDQCHPNAVIPSVGPLPDPDPGSEPPDTGPLPPSLKRTMIIVIYDEAEPEYAIVPGLTPPVVGTPPQLSKWNQDVALWNQLLQSAENYISVRVGVLQPTPSSVSGQVDKYLKCDQCAWPRDSQRPQWDHKRVPPKTGRLTAEDIYAFMLDLAVGNYYPTACIFVLDNSGSIELHQYDAALQEAKAAYKILQPQIEYFQDVVNTEPEAFVRYTRDALQRVINGQL